MWGILRRAAAAAVALPALGIATYAATNDNAQRSLFFWSRAFPIYLHYRAVQLKTMKQPEEKQDEALEELHDKYAPVMLDIILAMKGFYVKVGQIGSTRADFMPKQYLRSLEKLQDQVPAEPLSHVQDVVETSLGQDMASLFAWVDPEPLGAASIGQVHRARLHDGREVVVKVKFPDVEKNFKSDMDTIMQFCKLAQPEQVVYLEETQRQFMTEFDYQQEARNLSQVWHNIKPFYEKDVVMPEAIDELCTRDVLVMTYVPGIKFVDAVKGFYRTVAKQRGTTLENMEAEHQEALARGIIEQGPSEMRMQLAVAFAKASLILQNTLIAFANLFLRPFGNQLAYVKAELPLNIPKLLRIIVDVHGHQIFHDGVFNGDPHPGNLLVTDDGRVGLIDYGQVKRITLDDRIIMARLLLALREDDEEAIVRVHHEMGFRSQKQTPHVSKQLAVIAFDRDDRKTCEGMNLQQYVEHLGRIDPIVTGSQDHIMISRVSVLLRGLGTHLHYPMRMSEQWGEHAARLLTKHNIEV